MKRWITGILRGQELTINERDPAGALFGRCDARERVRTINPQKGSETHICVRAQEARNEREDKERDADDGLQKTCVMMIERGGSSHWANLMEVKAFDRRVYNT